MSNNIHPNLQAKLSNLSEEQIEQILTTEVPAVSLAERMKQLQEMLTNPNEITIEGWLCKNEYEDGFARIHIEEPQSGLDEMPITGEQLGIWRSNGDKYLISDELFPDLKWTDSPKKVKITIKTIDQ